MSTPVTVSRDRRGSATSRCSRVASSSEMRSATRRARAWLGMTRPSLHGDGLFGIGDELVADRKIVESLHGDPALETFADLSHVILLVPERRDIAVVDGLLAPHHPHPGVAPDLPLHHPPAGHEPDLGDSEDLQHP